MPLRVRFAYPSGNKLGISVERLADGMSYDFSPPPAAGASGTGGTFAASPATPILALPESAGSFAGQYKLTLPDAVTGSWSDGDYTIAVHDVGRINEAEPGNIVVAQLAALMVGGDDATPLPSALAAAIVKALSGKPIQASFTITS